MNTAASLTIHRPSGEPYWHVEPGAHNGVWLGVKDRETHLTTDEMERLVVALQAAIERDRS
jgi:hypothetical protein